ncbi:MAG TPA: 23S rRNA (pseudouridine(1915)-N(3))-methyltransferase RlmH [Patescibacteria group bacterium]|nr:23S rRNA (pseudouridine(1915)-N(3))-methyltransferase RlmH [Patescibacteria group bacterium]
MITVLAIGKKHEDWIIPGLERYQKRLVKPWDCTWELLPHSSLEGLTARQEESERILKRLNDDSFVVLLDETGAMLSSPKFASLCESQFTYGKSITCIIGGAYGVTDELKNRADYIWSLSPLVFPHQLVRLMLIEQLYRAQEIVRGGQYHHL